MVVFLFVAKVRQIYEKKVRTTKKVCAAHTTEEAVTDCYTPEW